MNKSEKMRSKFTTFLMIGLMLALPLRAVAGLVMFGCAPNHHTASIVSSGPSDAHSMQGMPGCHEAEHAPANGGHQCHQDHASTDKHASNTCSACGDCCAGAMSDPVHSQVKSAQEPKSELIVFPDRTYVGHHPEGPERPPRTTLS